MRLYRICYADHLQNYQGLGASYQDGGRWNEPGIPVLYFAESASVAMPEMANYLPSPRLVPPTYRLGVYDVAGNLPMERWTTADLPSGWDRFPGRHPRSGWARTGWPSGVHPCSWSRAPLCRAGSRISLSPTRPVSTRGRFD